MEGLNFDNILGEQEIENLFTAPKDSASKEPQEIEPQAEGAESNEPKEEKTTEVIAPDTLFEDSPESVGSEEHNEGEQEGTVSDEEPDGTSPNNFYSSIANALAVDGIFPNLDDETIKRTVDAESFSNLIEEEINARFDERQQRIARALDNGVEPSDIRKYEYGLNYVNSITDAAISEESENGEQLRSNLIYQDYINKGMTPEKAKKLTDRSINAGTDIDDAREALQSNKEYFAGQYNRLLKEAEIRAEAERAVSAKQAKWLHDSIMKDKQLWGDMEISNDMRKKAYDAISKPIFRDSDTGEYYTAIQKYETEHHADFLKYTGLIYAMTNGFKDFDSFTKGKVKKEMKRGLRELEQTLNNTRRAGDGSLRMVTSQREDPNAFISKGMKLDI